LKTGNNVRYLCPHKIDLTQNKEDVTLYFRVLSPKNNVKLVAKCGDEIIVSKKEFRVNPGEMNNITVDTSKINCDCITVEVVEE